VGVDWAEARDGGTIRNGYPTNDNRARFQRQLFNFYNCEYQLIPTSHEIWTFVGRPLAGAPSACQQAAYDGKSKNQTALV
jgi:hypothetical protein